MNHPLRTNLLVFACAFPLLAQETTVAKIDFGFPAFHTQGTVPQTWNDVHDNNMAMPFQLLDTTGSLTGWRFAVRPGTGFLGSNTSGTTAPVGALGSIPPSATRDSLFNRWTQGSYHPTIPQGTSNKAVLELTNLDQDIKYSFVFAASRENVGEVRTTDYAVLGFNGGLATLDAANNVSNVVEIAGILPDSSGGIQISVDTSSSNETPERYFYLGAMEIHAVRSPQRPVILGFDQPGLRASRAQGLGPFTTNLTAVESIGATPIVTLTAADEATGQPPTWMVVPTSVVANSPFGITLDGSGLGQGIHRAKVTGSAAGYPDFDLDVELVVRDPDVKNMLFYGNSFSAGRGCYTVSVPELFQSIAEEAGYPSPNVVARLVGSTYLSFHLTNPVHAEAITDSMRIGEAWDRVVLQGFSTEATETLGNPAQFRADAAALFANVRAHSPNARAVMFQTWARAPGHSFYPNTFSGPLEMHEQVRRNYRRCVSELNQQFGAGSATNAAVGDAIALHGFDPSIYCPDLYHGGPPLTLTAAMVIFTSVYGDRTCDISPDFIGPSSFATQMQTLGLTAGDWRYLSGIADRVAGRSSRLYPGSGEDLLLQTGVDGPNTACPVEMISASQTLSVSITSPNALYGEVPVFLIGEMFPTGSPPGPLPQFPEVQFAPQNTFFAASQTPLGSALSWSANMPPGSFAGLSLLLQGVALGPSQEMGNTRFTTTDAHEIRAQ